ncbi:MAG: hypothetical protein KTR31_20570 [Myxococcales bacterium]|nr:hypothetical protein [Myxococcales bacterium]
MIALMIGWMAAAASPGFTVEELMASARQAESTIAACQASTACAASPDELGEAFAVRAVAAALEGQLDREAAANASLLSPGAAERWGSLLPAAEVAPADWVVAWLATRMVGAAAEPPPAASVHPSPPSASELDAGPASVLRVSGRATLNGPLVGGVGEVDWRTGLGGLGLRVRAEAARSYLPIRLPSEVGQTSRLSVLEADTGTLALAVGPRWGGDGREVLVHGQLGIMSSALTGRTYRELARQDLFPDPATVGVRGGFGGVYLQPLLRRRAALRVESDVSWLSYRILPQHLSRARRIAASGEPTELDSGMTLEVLQGLAALVYPSPRLQVGLRLDTVLWRRLRSPFGSPSSSGTSFHPGVELAWRY